MQRHLARRVAACVACAVVLLAHAANPRVANASVPEPLAPPWKQLPLPVLRVTGGFCESRSNHFHAGLDFSTGGKVGAAVRAPFACWVERVRASGVGYGRSLYMRCTDGSTVVFGHLDAFAAPVAAWVDSAQRASGQYEQDLWPPAGRFRFTAGDTVAWTGESGAGGPHLHMEIRHGDFALDPLRAGIVQPGGTPPRLETLTLEPMDEESFVQRGAAPFTIPLNAPHPETLAVVGRVRAIVRSRAGLPGAKGVPAWSTSITWGGRSVEARLDSISWAGEMAEQDLVLDRGRITGSMGWILEMPAPFTPRLLRLAGSAEATVPAVPDARPWRGIIELKAGDPARELRIVACDAQGIAVARSVWLRGARSAERAPDTSGTSPKPRGGLKWSFASLPDARLRVTLTGVPVGIRAVHLGFAAPTPDVPATLRAGSWSAVLDASSPVGALRARGRRADGTVWEVRIGAVPWLAGARGSAVAFDGNFEFRLPPENVYEPGVLVLRASSGSLPTPGLRPVGGEFTIEPARTPLRRPATLVLHLPPAEPRTGVDLYRRDDGGGWSVLRATWDDSAHVFRAETSALGTFALRRDDTPPLVTLLPAPRRVPGGPYPRWQLEARVREGGSGIDASKTAFEIDGVRVPSEWDGEQQILRWRPRTPPAPGTHRVAVRAADRAGNAVRREGSFVLDSARR